MFIYSGLIFLILFLFVYKNYTFISLLGERFLFGPAVNKFLYYDFFSYYPKHYFADGIIGKCLGITYQYVATSGQLVFAFFYKGRLFESNSVTGYLGDGYAQAGFLGIILFAFLKVLLFKFISLTTNGVPDKIRIPMIIIPIFTLNDAGLLTVFFSGGLFLIILLFYIYPEENMKNRGIFFIEYKIRDFFKILSLNSQKILLCGIIFIFSSMILSEVSFDRAVNNYYHYLKIGDSEFVKLIFKNYFEHSNKLKNILTAGILGCILSSCFFILKNFIHVIEKLDKGEKMLENLINGKEKLAVVGMGYVGLPLAIAFSEKEFNVIGFDINQNKIEKYLNGEDPTNEVGDERIKNSKNIEFTSDETKLKEAKFIIVAVPTPVLENKMPDLRPLEGASTVIGRNLSKGTIVVYESTVYPGATEEVCLPILERESGLKCGVDFKIGYSPERINPADKVNTLTKIMKITSGMDKESSDIIADVYSQVITAGIHRASSIKVAEAAKVIENSQRDINIAFVNELSLIFDRIGIDTLEVLEAAGTKWNFLPYRPGLVGGHCIGVDPYYLANKASELGYHAQVILAGRRINDNMAKFVAEKTIKKLINDNIRVKGADILVMGLTFKENCPDLRNSKVNDIIKELREYGANVHVIDPMAPKEEALEEYGIILEDESCIKNMDAVVIAVGHKEYRDMKPADLRKYFNPVYAKPLLIDVKSIFNKAEAEKEYDYWRL